MGDGILALAVVDMEGLRFTKGNSGPSPTFLLFCCQPIMRSSDDMFAIRDEFWL